MFKKKELLKLSNDLWNKSRDEYLQIYSDEDVYKDIMDYRKYYCKIVADLAIEMFDEFYSQLFADSDTDDTRKNSLYFACLVHDIKKINPKHSKAGAKFIKDADEIREITYINKSIVRKIIKYHKSKKNKKDSDYLKKISNMDNELKFLIVLIRISDKLSKLIFKSEYMNIDEGMINIVMDKVINNSNEFIYNDKLNKIIFSIKNRFIYKYHAVN